MERFKTFWPRFWAGLIDGFCVSVLHFVFVFPLGLLVGVSIHATNGPAWPVALLSTAAGFFPIAYSVFLHGRFGQTFGKMAMSIKVLHQDEQRIPSYREALMRDIGLLALNVAGAAMTLYRAASGMPLAGPGVLASRTVFEVVLEHAAVAWYVLEIISMLTNEKRRALHDYIAGTVVVRVPKARAVAARPAEPN